MNARGLRRYVDDLLRARRPKPFQPDDFEAAQIRTAIELQAARLGADAPRQEFLTDLHRRLADQMEGSGAGSVAPAPAKGLSATRRQVIVGTSAAAAAVAAGVTAGVVGDRIVAAPRPDNTGGDLQPSDGSWHVVASSADVPDGVMHPFEVGPVVGFVRRVNGRAEAVSGVCTHQGCKLWFDQPDDQLRCPCHTTSFSPTGQVVNHALPIAPKPLPRLEVREHDGVIEVLAPKAPPSQPA
ncbi:MAG: Rieske (2Fe-2S) protein [Mycobacteriaceae bacterium]|nr:Rieske (2Fe-2S) protein [Mycobacteriaceae bacterium]